jgi:uncharacterized membrane protein YjfL (UPF0719 family)
MNELMISYKDQLVLLCSFFAVPVLAFLISLGVVFLLGRMLELVKHYRTKNLIAFLTMVGTCLFYFSKIESSLSLHQKIWNGAIYLSSSIILYTTLGFKFYERMDALLDKKIAPDKGKKPK